jgi:hypothetical protein
MNIFSALIIAIVTTIILLSSLGNLIFLKSEEVKEREIFQKAKNFYEVLKRIEKIEASNFLHEHFLGLSNVSIKNGILSIELEGKRFNFFIGYGFEETEIKNKGRYCILKIAEKLKVFSCEEYFLEEIGECNVLKCKLNSRDCLGPNKMCIGDGFCNTFIKENCKNSIDCDCRNLGSNYICCPENPNSDEKGCLKLESKKKKGEECYCSEECEENLECNPVASTFTSYRKACCEKGKVWNGSECIAIKKFRIVFVPISYGRDEFDKFKSDAEDIYKVFLKVSPFRECPNPSERVEAYYIDPKDCNPSCPSVCFDEIFRCVQNSPYKDNYDIIHGVCKAGKCAAQWGFCGIAVLNGIFFFPVSQSDYVCHIGNHWTPLHEIGHTFGLNHIDFICDSPDYACLPPNAEDCHRPSNEKQYDLMTYCPFRDRYGPAGYAHIKSILKSMKYLEGC